MLSPRRKHITEYVRRHFWLHNLLKLVKFVSILRFIKMTYSWVNNINGCF